jgi:hypothetical protein
VHPPQGSLNEKSGSFWLSDYTQMFDTSEIKHGFNVGMKLLREAYEESPKTGRLRRFLKGTEKVAERGLPEYFHGYILSLTLSADQLTQWEIYGDRTEGNRNRGRRIVQGPL